MSVASPLPSPPVAPVIRRRAADEVFDQLAKMVIVGDLESGARLPAEKDLASSFEVSRLIVRQAVHRLAQLGLVRPRQGGVTTIMDWKVADHPQVSVLALRFSPQRNELLASLRERQVVGSLSMLVLAARRIDQQGIDLLRDIVDDFERNPAKIDRLNESFWTCIADITGNPFFQRDTRFWFRIAREEPAVERRTNLTKKTRIAGYRAVVSSLGSGQPVQAYLPIINKLLDVIEGTSN